MASFSVNDSQLPAGIVISSAAKRSGAEWRNLTPKCGKPMVAGDLSALRFNKVQSP